MNSSYGILHQPNIKLQRGYFQEMVNLRGVFCDYRYPLSDKHYTTQGELESNYSESIKVGCIFNEHIDAKTQKKLGWNAELQEEVSIISVPYDLEGIQTGALFSIPSPFDDTPNRLFRVVELSAIPAYPASITCRLVPEYETTVSQASTHVFTNSDFNLLNQEDEEHEL